MMYFLFAEWIVATGNADEREFITESGLASISHGFYMSSVMKKEEGLWRRRRYKKWKITKIYMRS